MWAADRCSSPVRWSEDTGGPKWKWNRQVVSSRRDDGGKGRNWTVNRADKKTFTNFSVCVCVWGGVKTAAREGKTHNESSSKEELRNTGRKKKKKERKAVV